MCVTCQPAKQRALFVQWHGLLLCGGLSHKLPHQVGLQGPQTLLYVVIHSITVLDVVSCAPVWRHPSQTSSSGGLQPPQTSLCVLSRVYCVLLSNQIVGEASWQSSKPISFAILLQHCHKLRHQVSACMCCSRAVDAQVPVSCRLVHFHRPCHYFLPPLSCTTACAALQFDGRAVPGRLSSSTADAPVPAGDYRCYVCRAMDPYDA
jgi:hypothetical protein